MAMFNDYDFFADSLEQEISRRGSKFNKYLDAEGIFNGMPIAEITDHFFEVCNTHWLAPKKAILAELIENYRTKW